jgi:ABC-type spermidine/putrescine transport system permease subunit II
MSDDPRVAVAGRERRSRRLLRAVDHWVLPVFTVLAIAYLLLPITVMIIFSFNDPIGRFNYQWNEFSLEAWQNPLARPGLPEALRNSIVTVIQHAKPGGFIHAYISRFGDKRISKACMVLQTA